MTIVLHHEPRSVRTPGDAAPLNLASVDLNLLVALDALLEYCNVTHAAGAVGLSQPAMSRTLSRLRDMLDDDLLVRTSAGYVRSIRGDWLHDRLPATLDGIRRLIASGQGLCEGWLATMRLAMPDHQALLLGRQVLLHLAERASDREIAIEPLGANVFKRLEAGEVEMAVGQVTSLAVGFFQRSLYVDDHACLVRMGHPALTQQWSPALFYDMQHAVSTPVQNGEPDHVGRALAAGLHRNPSIVSPNTLGTAMAVAESDMVLTVPRRVAVKLTMMLPLQMVEPPIEIDPYEVMLLWHERCHRNAEHEWMRAKIAAAMVGRSSARAEPR